MPRKRRYRRRRYRRMRGMLSGRKRFRRRRRIPKYDEVKTYATGIGNQVIRVQFPGAADSTMYRQAFIYNNMLNVIPQGTDYFNRIGNQIYVLNIKVKFNVWLCSPDLYELNTGILRVIVGEPIGVALNSDFPGFFRQTGKDRTIQPLNRKKYTFKYDRVYNITSGYTNRLQNTVDPLKHTGAIRHYEFNLPVNRRVEYTTDGTIKNQRDQYSLFATAFLPNPYDLQQAFCSNWSWTIYYVDA